MNLYRKRKFTVAYTALWMVFVLALTGDMDGGNVVASISAILGLYGMANVAVHFSKNEKEPTKPDIKAVK